MFKITDSLLMKSIEASNLAHTISTADTHTTLAYANPAFYAMTGYEKEEVIGYTCRFLQGAETNPDSVSAIRSAISLGQDIDIEILNYRKDGRPFWNRLQISPIFEGNRRPVAFIGIQSDVTYIREQERLNAARQKMESLGRLSANISHEIRNAIQPIKLMSEVLHDFETLSPEKIRKSLRILDESLDIVNKVVNATLKFSRPSNQATQIIEVDSLVNDLGEFLINLIPTHIDFRMEIANLSSYQVKIDPSQISQISLNMVNNALHAMEKNGKFTFSANHKNIEASFAHKHNLEPGDFLVLGYSDNGRGIPAQTLPHIFEPFFTTKSPDKGTGLGLSTALGLAKNWGGTLTVKSAPFRGSEFQLYVPLLTNDVC